MTDVVSFSELIKSNVIKNKETSSTDTKVKKNSKCSQCPASVRIQTYGNAAKHIENNDKGELVLYENKAYYACTRPSYENCDLCWRHSNAQDVLNFSEIKEKGCILTKDHPYFNKYRSKNKKSSTEKSDKYTIEVPNDTDLIKKIEELITNYSNNKKKTEISTDSEETDNITMSVNISEEDLIEVNDHVGEDTKIINSLIEESNSDNEDSNGSSDGDSDGSVIEMEEIVTKKKYGCRSLGINEKMEVYDPDGDLLGILLEVDDSKAPIEHEGKNCIVSVDKEIDGIKYKKCTLSDRVYDYTTNELKGKMSKKGELKPLKKK